MTNINELMSGNKDTKAIADNVDGLIEILQNIKKNMDKGSQPEHIQQEQPPILIGSEIEATTNMEVENDTVRQGEWW